MKNLRGVLVLTLLLIFASPQKLWGQAPHVQHPADLGDFTKEIMMLDFKDGNQYLVMWLPFEFSVTAALASGKGTKADAEANL